MAFCVKCGAQLPEGAGFCNNCGAAQGAGEQAAPQMQPQSGMQYQQPQMQQAAQQGGMQYQQPQMQQQFQAAPQMRSQPPKKSRTGLIIGLVCGSVALVAGIVVLILFLTGVIGGGKSNGGNTDGFIRVSTVEELVEAIRPQAKIRMEPGYYNLNGFLARYSDAGAREAWNEEHPYVRIEEVFDGMEIIITNVYELTLEGGTDHPADTEIVTDPRYAAVLRFDRCTGVEINCLTMGHTDRGDCAGDVLSFNNTQNIVLQSLDLYGCGVYGIGCDQYSGNLYVSDSVIRDCEYGPFAIYNGEGDFSFTNCTFSGSAGGGHFEYNDNSRLSFNTCSFGQEESNIWYFDEFANFENCEFMEPEYYPDVDPGV